jgi:dihydroorotate dehydrogenase electron transfer subunit
VAERTYEPVRLRAEVLSTKQSGGYVVMSLVAGPVAERARPGSFVMVGVGGETSGLLMPRGFWIQSARPTGAFGGTIDVVFAARGAGTRWLAALRPHDRVDVTGPLGRPYSLPREPVSCALVGVGHSASPLFLLAERLRERQCAVHLILGGESATTVFGALEARRAHQSVTVVTADGSTGLRGSVADVLPDVCRKHDVDVVYACGVPQALDSIQQYAGVAGVVAQYAVETPMPCGVGLCSSCLLPVTGRDGTVHPARCCVDGPVFPGERVDWDVMRPQWT